MGYAEREKLYRRFEGKEVYVTTGHETILHQKGEKPVHIPYEVKRRGRIKRYRGKLRFVERGRRTPYSFIGAEFKGIIPVIPSRDAKRRGK